MKKQIAKAAAILIAAAMLIPLVSCAPKEPIKTGNNTGATVTKTATEEITEEKEPDLVMPEGMLDREFRILGTSAEEYNNNLDIFATEKLDEPINDSVYDRNQKLLDNYGITITGTISTTVYSDAQKNIQANDDVYDMYMVPMNDASTLAMQDYLVDLKTIEWLNIDNPWWDQNANRDLSINHKIYFTTGDISLLDEDLCFCIIFNKDALQTLNLPDPYQMVKDKTWTIDNFMNIIKDVYTDDGNGKPDTYDQWGLMTHVNNATVWYLGTGERMITKDENDLPVFGMDSPRAAEAMEKVLSAMTSDKIIRGEDITNDRWATQLAMTVDGRSVFRSTIFSVARDLRSMKMDFGILPNPLLDENQENYCTFTSAWQYLPGVCVPTTNSSLEETGAILEAMAYWGHEIIKPAFYDVSLKGILLRDEESKDMLDIIFGSKVYDIGYIYDIGGMRWILRDLAQQKSTSFSSSVDAIRDKVNTGIEDLITKYGA
ncbi:MAG: hypothetical protein VB118_08195 [Oscillospiraceae bacterium]|nr:hypothetical protein [Oscillospiraceae bacterium]